MVGLEQNSGTKQLVRSWLAENKSHPCPGVAPGECCHILGRLGWMGVGATGRSQISLPDSERKGLGPPHLNVPGIQPSARHGVGAPRGLVKCCPISVSSENHKTAAIS